MANTLVGLAIIYACVFFLGLGDVAANLIGYAAGLLIGFAINKSWTFGHRGGTPPALGRYALVVLAAYMANLVSSRHADEPSFLLPAHAGDLAKVD